MNNILTAFYRYWKSIILAIFILVLCLIPASELNKLNVNISFGDLAVHFILFGVFSTAVYADMIKPAQNAVPNFSLWFTALVISVALGLITELLQFLLASLNRSGSLVDLMFDLLGSLSGIGFIRLIKRKPVPAP
jgi:hypothetical protein